MAAHENGSGAEGGAEEEQVGKKRQRGRPKGSKDSAPRKVRSREQDPANPHAAKPVEGEAAKRPRGRPKGSKDTAPRVRGDRYRAGSPQATYLLPQPPAPAPQGAWGAGGLQMFPGA
eukprot:CAMPEP_0206270842 /NCGR_PEP_ID=MMETSP0047_2-20121206/33090_1 /ASSEMBLY_ACC=CAM_ASM_000192 /TAXON_ID=195065 /ORGANISM="Chroomonas mesostigmatica_cf, Strain CCMP1168" /LENGTH=116 /DNA_ID=CAMNT_0053699523 /DNA_START=33 /DNA_END=379 /DNA_ORIENTATION=+